jgi:hypothetical protein
MFQLTGSRLLSALAMCCLTAGAGLAQRGHRLYSVSPVDPNLRVVDPLTATTLSSLAISAPGVTVDWANGLSIHPATGELWAMLQLRNVRGRTLAKINPTTAAATVIGNTGDSFAGIAFDAAGTLYGVTGDGGTSPETLFTLNPMTGAPTLFLTLGNGTDGETIAWHPGTSRILHASGIGTQNTTEILETIDPGTKAIVNVPLSGDDYDEAIAMTHWVGDNFLVADINDDLFVVSGAGVVSRIGTLDHTAKGFAFELPPNAAHFSPYGSGCPATGGYVEVLAGSGTPSANSTITIGIVNGLGGAPAILLMGLGQNTLAVGPNCTVQNMPILPFVIPVLLAGAGPGKGTMSLSMQIPAGTQPGDIFFQVLPFEGLTPLVTTPLKIHIQ